jgi:hypothetical protein
MRVVIAVIIGFAAGSSVLGQTSPQQRGTPVIPINRAPTSESVVVTQNQAWHVQATDHFDIYHQAPQPQVDAAALEAERAYVCISVNMNHELAVASQYSGDGVRRYIAVLSSQPQSGGGAIQEAFSTSPAEFNRAVEAYARGRFQ